MTLERKHYYKVSRNSVYLGLLPNVVSPFTYSQDINTGSTETVIEVMQSLDTAFEDVLNLETEDGNPITTEDNQNITTERSEEIIGEKDSGLLIANGNDIDVYEYSDDDPNGVLVFSGYISGWKNTVGFGDKTEITVISNGKDMDDYVYGNSAFTLQTSMTVAGDFLDFAPAGSAGRYVSVGGKAIDIIYQQFSGHGYSLSKLQFALARGTYTGGIPASVTVTMKLYEGANNTGTLLDTVTATVSTGYPTFTYTDFVLNSAILLDSSKTYHVRLTSTDYTSINVSGIGTGSGTYGGGFYQWFVTGIGMSGAGTDDVDFKLYTGSILTDAAFTSTDPSVMVKNALTYGGEVTYTASSIDLTGLSITYTFRLATVLEIVKKALELAPSGWYWFVDPATQVLTFKATSTTPTHYFTLHKEVEKLEIESTIEFIKNVVYFSGGPTAGVNLLKLYTDTASLAINKRGLARLSDNRVTLAATAQTLSEGLMAENSDEEFLSTCTVLGEKYDIDSIQLGDTVAFQSFGNFVDRLVLQVTKIKRGGDYVDLTLGKLKLKTSTYVDDIKRDLNNQQTLDNPNTPS